MADWVRRRWKPVAGILAAAALALGVVEKTIGVLDLFREHRSPASATIEVDNDIEAATLGKFLVQHRPLNAVNAAQRATNGVVFTLHLELKGLEGRKCAVRFWAYEGQTRRELPLPSWTPRLVQIVPKADEFATDPDIWVPIPLQGDSFYARFDVVCNSDGRLAHADSKSFRIA